MKKLFYILLLVMFVFGCETTSDEASSTLGQVEVPEIVVEEAVVEEVVVEETVETQKEIVHEPVAPVKVETPQEIFDRRQEESIQKLYNILHAPEYSLNYSDRWRIWGNVCGPMSSDEEIMKNRKLAEPLVTEKKNITGKIVNPTDKDLELSLGVYMRNLCAVTICDEKNSIIIPANGEYYVIIENGLENLLANFSLGGDAYFFDGIKFGELNYWLFIEDQWNIIMNPKEQILNMYPNLLYNLENFSYITEIFKTHSFQATCLPEDSESDIKLIQPLDENEIRNYDNLLIIKAN